MNLIEIFVLFGGGYLCGLSLGSGFAFQSIRKLFAYSWNAKREAVWIALAMPNILICTLMSVFLVGALVVGDQPGRADFWQRFACYVLGILAGSVLVFAAVHLFNIRAHHTSKVAGPDGAPRGPAE